MVLPCRLRLTGAVLERLTQAQVDFLVVVAAGITLFLRRYLH
jgi:hypothetical protein